MSVWIQSVTQTNATVKNFLGGENSLEKKQYNSKTYNFVCAFMTRFKLNNKLNIYHCIIK